MSEFILKKVIVCVLSKKILIITSLKWNRLGLINGFSIIIGIVFLMVTSTLNP